MSQSQFPPELLTPRSNSASPEPRPIDNARLERWQRQLLDLNLRNPLLNFKSGKRFVELLVADAAGLENALADGQTFRLLSRKQPDRLPVIRKSAPNSKKDRAEKQADTGELSTTPETLESLIGFEPEKQARQKLEQLMLSGSLATALTEAELSRRLTALYRASRNALEESGSGNLFIALGFLRWQPAGKDNICHAPLLLYPVRIERKLAGKIMTLVPDGDEPRFNLTLAEALRRDYGINGLNTLAADLPFDDAGFDVAAIFRVVAGAVSQQNGWQVLPGAALGVFSFARQLMWQDLQASNAFLMLNPVVRHLLERNAPMYPDEPPFIAPESLDDTLDPATLCCPLPVDSSQLAAVASASRGKDFVLVGPPGTGKSQTIANLIANAMAQGKTVLFVAEKAAALNVVYRRLKHLGLGDLCLELHSSKSSKTEVLDQLAAAASAKAELRDEDWLFACKRLCDLRDTLNRYTSALHRRYPNGMTVHEAIGAVLSGKNVTELSFLWPDPAGHTREQLQNMADTAQKLSVLAAAGRELGATALADIRALPVDRDFIQDTVSGETASSGKAPNTPSSWTPQWQSDVLAAAEALQSSIKQLFEQAGEAEANGWHDVTVAAQENFPALLQLCDITANFADPLVTRALQPDAEALLPVLDERLADLRQADELWGRLSVRYGQSVLDADLPALQRSWEESRSAWWPKNSLMQRSVIKELMSHSLSGGQEPRCAEDLSLLARIRDLLAGTSLRQERRGMPGGLESLGGSALEKLREHIRQVASCLHSLYPQPEQQQAARLHLLQQASRSGPQNTHSPQGELNRSVQNYAEKAQALAGLIRNFPSWLNTPLKAEAACREIIARRNELNQWCGWSEQAEAARAAGLSPLVDALMAGSIAPQECARVFHVNYCRWFTRAAVNAESALSGFQAAGHENAIQEFARSDAAVQSLAPARIHALARKDDLLEGAASAENALLQREAAKKRKRMPIRRLVSSLPTLLTRLTPCLLMSPLSVAQYLAPGKQMFDLVIFDEASQIPVWAAVGAMSRGRRVMVAGDPMQLPPTSFFQRADFGDESEGDASNAYGDAPDAPTEDMESILDECLASGLPAMRLLWHYRSRSESLISFSNARYYDDKLVTFPAPAAHDDAVSFHPAGGVYDRGGSRTNPAEARALVDHLLQSLRTEPGRSYGVVTFNMQQQRLIEDMLDEERRADPSLETFFSDDLEEPVLVKNLENIQGDERDVIYFSIGFAPDSNGAMTMNFGALNTAGGERRLNVAVTRAKRALRVFCSFEPANLNGSEASPQGVRDLQLFLRYAQQGVSVLPGHAANENAALRDAPFSRSVGEALAGQGWDVRPHVGNSALRIDLGVLGTSTQPPSSPGDSTPPNGRQEASNQRFLAGVETDGPMYAMQPTARDRDISRPGVLAGLGWALRRAWSLDWWLHEEASANALDKNLRQLALQKPEPAGNATEKNPATGEAASEVRQDADMETPAQKTDPQEAEPSAFELLERSRIANLLEDLVNREYPLHLNVALRAARRGTGEARMSAKLKTMVQDIASERFQTSRESNGVFLWPKTAAVGRCERFIPMGERQAENIHELSLFELAALARSLPVDTREGTVARMGEALGLTRLTAKSRAFLEEAWKYR